VYKVFKAKLDLKERLVYRGYRVFKENRVQLAHLELRVQLVKLEQV
jgi:hypothetical protein